MKSTLIIFFSIVSLSIFSQTQSPKFVVPTEAKIAFRTQYPKASEAYWRPYFKVYQVTFFNDVNGKYFGTKAWYNGDGEWLKTVEAIESKSLPKAIQDYLNQHFQNESLGMFQKITRPEGTPNFSIVTGSFERTRTLLFDESGKIIDVDFAPIDRG